MPVRGVTGQPLAPQPWVQRIWVPQTGVPQLLAPERLAMAWELPQQARAPRSLAVWLPPQQALPEPERALPASQPREQPAPRGEA